VEAVFHSYPRTGWGGYVGRMHSVFAQTGSALPSGFAEVIAWLLVAAVIVGLYLVLRRTRINSRRHYMDRAEREEEQRRNDPDMR